MMKRSRDNRRAFCVVQFVELPFEGIDDYVCVPYTWLRKVRNEKAFVAYPKDEDPFNTRDRAERKERYNDEWKGYMAIVKFESDSYNDAEFWIATRNDYGPLKEELETTDTEPKFPLNKKLREGNRNHSLNINQSRVSIKRPALPELNKQLDGKRMKPDDAAQSSSAVVTGANAEPGSSRQEQSIITQDNQPMESAQTETTASDSKDVDTPTRVIDDDEEVQPIMEQQVPSNQVISQFTEQPEPIREPRIQVGPSIEMTSNNQGSRMDDVFNNGPTSHHLLSSPKMQAQLKRQMNEARRLIPTQKPVERIIRPMNIASSAIAEQNPSILDQTRSISTRSVPTQQQYPTWSYQNQYLPTNQNNFEQDLLRKSGQGNNYEQRPNSRTISMSTLSVEQNSIIPSDLLYQTSELPQQRQSQATQQDAQRQPQKPKIRIGISIKPKNNRQGRTLQGVEATNQDNFEQDLRMKSAEGNNYEQRPNSRTISMSTLSIGQNSITASNSLYQTSELPQQRQSQATQQDSQRQPQKPKIRIGISIKPKNNRQGRTLQGVERTNQNNFEQDLRMKSAEGNNYEQRPNSRTISMSTLSIGQNSITPSNSLYQTSELPRQRQSQATQQDSQRQPQKPKIRIGISIKPKNNRQGRTLQGVEPTNQNNFEQDLRMKSAEGNNYEQRPNSRTISMSTLSIGQNSITPSNSLYQTSELPRQRQSQATQQDSQRQPQKPKIRIGISITPKNNRQGPTLQGVEPTNQNNFEQDLRMQSAEGNNYEQRPNSRAISMSLSTLSDEQNSIIPSNPLYQTSELPQQRQSQPTQQDSQRQPQKPKIRIGISIKPKNNRQGRTLQGVTKKASSSSLSVILTKVLNSVRQAVKKR